MPHKFRDNYLLFQLAVVSENFSAEFHALLKEHGMSAAKWRILCNLAEVPCMHITELAAHTLLEQSHVTKLTDQLCSEKLVKKQVSKTDRRRVTVSITARGLSVVNPLIEEAKAHEEKVLSRIKPQDAKKLKSILKILVEPHLKTLQSE